MLPLLCTNSQPSRTWFSNISRIRDGDRLWYSKVKPRHNITFVVDFFTSNLDLAYHYMFMWFSSTVRHSHGKLISFSCLSDYFMEFLPAHFKRDEIEPSYT